MHDAMPIAEKKIGPFLLLHQAQFGLNPALVLSYSCPRREAFGKKKLTILNLHFVI
jgi:hypothetical protein